MDVLKGWHDFFVVLGAAAGTLIGAMFVVVSIGSGLVKQENLASRIFVTPTIVHLAVVLMACAFVLVPSLTWTVLGAAAGVAGIAVSSAMPRGTCSTSADETRSNGPIISGTASFR